MSDGRNFTDYTSQRQQMIEYRQKYKTLDSRSLRQALITNANSIMNTNNCTKKQESTMHVWCASNKN